MQRKSVAPRQSRGPQAGKGKGESEVRGPRSGKTRARDADLPRRSPGTTDPPDKGSQRNQAPAKEK